MEYFSSFFCCFSNTAIFGDFLNSVDLSCQEIEDYLLTYYFTGSRLSSKDNAVNRLNIRVRLCSHHLSFHLKNSTVQNRSFRTEKTQ